MHAQSEHRVNDGAVKVREEPKLVKLFLETFRSLARGLVTLIGCETEKDYVLRPWTEEEDEDFAKFCALIDVTPSDPEWAEAMEDGEIDFFNNDPFVGVKLYRA